MKINPDPIKSELQELTENESVKVKLDRKLDTASSIRVSDGAYEVRLNPSKIRSEATLEKHLGYCRRAIGGL